MLAALAWCLFIAAAVGMAVRYLVPSMLAALVDPLCGFIGLLAALFVLPEFWISRTYRRGRGCPPSLAYLYGDGVIRLARLGHRSIRTTLRSLATAAHATPPFAVGLVVAAWQGTLLLPVR